MSYYDETPSPKEHSDTNETRRNRSRRYATMSMMCGIFAFFSLFLSFSAAILLGIVGECTVCPLQGGRTAAARQRSGRADTGSYVYHLWSS